MRRGRERQFSESQHDAMLTSRGNSVRRLVLVVCLMSIFVVVAQASPRPGTDRSKERDRLPNVPAKQVVAVVGTVIAAEVHFLPAKYEPRPCTLARIELEDCILGSCPDTLLVATAMAVYRRDGTLHASGYVNGGQPYLLAGDVVLLVSTIPREGSWYSGFSEPTMHPYYTRYLASDPQVKGQRLIRCERLTIDNEVRDGLASATEDPVSRIVRRSLTTDSTTLDEAERGIMDFYASKEE